VLRFPSLEQRCSSLVEFRQYTLHPGTRDVLIDLFDSELVKPQEDVGMNVIGQFRDIDDANRFVWFRGFRDMSQRAQSLAEFYGGPIWKLHRDAANATMIDSSDVLLLRPAREDSTFSSDDPERTAGGVDPGLVEATIFYLASTGDKVPLLSFFEQTIAPNVHAEGGSILAYFLTETAENSYPSLPVREGENAFVFVAGYADRVGYARHASVRKNGRHPLPPGLDMRRPPQILRLLPTSASFLTGRSSPCDRLRILREPRKENHESACSDHYEPGG
jgi:NIPSNAP